jgi:hypothetical protein
MKDKHAMQRRADSKYSNISREGWLLSASPIKALRPLRLCGEFVRPQL